MNLVNMRYLAEVSGFGIDTEGVEWLETHVFFNFEHRLTKERRKNGIKNRKSKIEGCNFDP